MERARARVKASVKDWASVEARAVPARSVTHVPRVSAGSTVLSRTALRRNAPRRIVPRLDVRLPVARPPVAPAGSALAVKVQVVKVLVDRVLALRVPVAPVPAATQAQRHSLRTAVPTAGRASSIGFSTAASTSALAHVGAALPCLRAWC